MPKEQGHFGAARGTSKNAKDKSNSATLRASQSGAHREQTGMANMTNCMLRCDSEKDSEKDSGYSEAGSDSLHADVDDQRSSVSEPHRQSTKSSSSNNVYSATNSMPPNKEMTPVYVIKNMMVKPSRTEQLMHSPLAWGGAWHDLTSTKGSTQLLLIQQPAIPAPTSSSIASPKNHAKKLTGRSNQPHKNSYLPILNSYPRIAPHPRKEGHESKGSTRAAGVKESGGEGQSQSKRVCTEEEKREAVSTTTHLLKLHQQQRDVRVHSQHKSKSSTSHRPTTGQASQSKGRPSHQSSNSDNISSPSVSSTQTPSPPYSSDSTSSSSPPSSSPSSSVAQSPYRPAPDSTSMKQRRFHNTAEILNQSGLLAITLRTKELLKQNAATEREIAQLRQHTEYLCQAALASQSGSIESIQGLEKLVKAMNQSGSYPELDMNQLQALSTQTNKSKDENDEKNSNQATTNALPSVISLRNIDDGTSPPSPLFAPSPETEGS
uniref:Si:ch211-132b12.7 n=1 Tax=Neogobius melanostomus TaxID=47308 RepID=A0A8C6TMF1_9GOBI